MQTQLQYVKDLLESAGKQPTDPKVVNKESTSPVSDDKTNEGKELVVHTSKEKKDEIILAEDDSDEDDKQPLSKRFKITAPIDIQNPIPLRSFIPEHPLKSEEQQKSLQEFTDQLFKITSLQFSPTPPR
ncbi:hypothetical protein Tco_0898565, partial [Tanacetum coccineum]